MSKLRQAMSSQELASLAYQQGKQALVLYRYQGCSAEHFHLRQRSSHIQSEGLPPKTKFSLANG